MKKVLYVASAIVLAGLFASCQKENPSPVANEVRVVNVNLSEGKAGVDLAPVAALTKCVCHPVAPCKDSLVNHLAKLLSTIASGNNGDGQNFDWKNRFWYHGNLINETISAFVKYSYQLNPDAESKFIHLDLVGSNKYSVNDIDLIIGTDLTADMAAGDNLFYLIKSVSVIWSYLGETYKLDFCVNATNVKTENTIFANFAYSVLDAGADRTDQNAYHKLLAYDGKLGKIVSDIHITTDYLSVDLDLNDKSNDGELVIVKRVESGASINDNQYVIRAFVKDAQKAVKVSFDAIRSVANGGMNHADCQNLCNEWNSCVIASCTFYGPAYTYSGGEYIKGERTAFKESVVLEPRGLYSDKDAWNPALFVYAPQKPETGVSFKYFNAIQMFGWTPEQWTEFYMSLPENN